MNSRQTSTHINRTPAATGVAARGPAPHISVAASGASQDTAVPGPSKGLPGAARDAHAQAPHFPGRLGALANSTSTGQTPHGRRLAQHTSRSAPTPAHSTPPTPPICLLQPPPGHLAASHPAPCRPGGCPGPLAGCAQGTAPQNWATRRLRATLLQADGALQHLGRPGPTSPQGSAPSSTALRRHAPAGRRLAAPSPAQLPAAPAAAAQ
jgi:hypothetical protein